MTSVQSYRGTGSGMSDGAVGRLANGLGWFSVGLGLAELMAPGAVGELIGIGSRPKTKRLLQFYGVREIAAGLGILTQSSPSGWMKARVAGDAVDLTSLVNALGRPRNDKAKLGLAIASVAGVTAADIYCAQQLSKRDGSNANVSRSIIVQTSAEEAYRFWSNVENLPRFMRYLESVRHTGERRTHWVANGPAGVQIEWDAETIATEPNRRITWRSLEGSDIEHSRSVHFEPAPGNRGTLVRVEMDFSGNRAAVALGKLFQMDVGRRIMHDLRNFKQVIEVGEVTQSDASIHEGMHPAQPLYA